MVFHIPTAYELDLGLDITDKFVIIFICSKFKYKISYLIFYSKYR